MADHFRFFFPLGAFVMRLMHNQWTVKTHVAVQLLALALAITGMGTGIWMATSSDEGYVSPPCRSTSPIETSPLHTSLPYLT